MDNIHLYDIKIVPKVISAQDFQEIPSDHEYSDAEIEDDLDLPDEDIEYPQVDIINLEKPLTVSRYAEIIIRNDIHSEQESISDIDSFSETQKEVTHKMRKILVTWLINVHNDYCFSNDTLYTAIKYLDLYLSTKNIAKNRLQLLGAVCYWLSCKVNELQVPYAAELSDLCNIKYTNQEFFELESDIFQTLNFQLNYPTYKGFLRRYLTITGASSKIHDVSAIICESCLLNYSLSCCLPSEVAIAIVIISYFCLNLNPPVETLKHYLVNINFDLISTIIDCVVSTFCEMIESKSGSTYQKFMDRFSIKSVKISRDSTDKIKKLLH